MPGPIQGPENIRIRLNPHPQRIPPRERESVQAHECMDWEHREREKGKILMNSTSHRKVALYVQPGVKVL